MGNCFSDVQGGKQAVGGVQERPTGATTMTHNDGGHNDAVDFFYRSRGLQQLFTQIEVIAAVFIMKLFVAIYDYIARATSCACVNFYFLSYSVTPHWLNLVLLFVL